MKVVLGGLQLALLWGWVVCDREKFGFRVVRSEATRLQYSVDVLLQIVAVAGRIDWLIE